MTIQREKCSLLCAGCPPFTAGPTLYRCTHLRPFQPSDQGPAGGPGTAEALRSSAFHTVWNADFDQRSTGPIREREEVDDSTFPSLLLWNVALRSTFQRSRGIIRKGWHLFSLERPGYRSCSTLPPSSINPELLPQSLSTLRLLLSASTLSIPSIPLLPLPCSIFSVHPTVIHPSCYNIVKGLRPPHCVGPPLAHAHATESSFFKINDISLLKTCL